MVMTKPNQPSQTHAIHSSAQIQLPPPQKDSKHDLLLVYFKGMAMGAADIVPGVSGGTIALIAGIYQRLIHALSNMTLGLIATWQHTYQADGIKGGISAIWRTLDGTFLLCLLAGIITSFAVLANLVRHLLTHQPLAIWSFFFGLVMATVVVLLGQIERWNVARVGLFVLGAIMAVMISLLPFVSATPSLPYLFFAGAIAICAMILPGISGSFILLLLGVYEVILDAVHRMDIGIILTVVAGMVTGLLLFTKFLKWLLVHYYQGTLVLLTGFIAGSLVKIWPWQVDAVHFLPWQYPDGARWGMTLGLMGLGMVSVLLLTKLGSQKQTS